MHYALSNFTFGRNIIQEKAHSAIRTTEQVPMLTASGRAATAWCEVVYKANSEGLVLYTFQIESILTVLIRTHDYHRKTIRRSIHIENNQKSVHRRCYLVLTGQPVHRHTNQFAECHHSVVNSVVTWGISCERVF